MNRKKIAIVGGGLSGLYAAYLLEKNGISDYLLLEARGELGGRIMDFSVDANDQRPTHKQNPHLTNRQYWKFL